MSRPGAELRLSDQVLFVVLGTGVRTAVDLCLMVVLARALTQTDFGVYRQVLITYGLVAGVVTLGLPASLTYFIPGTDRSTTRWLTSRTLGILTLLSLAGAALILPFGSFIAASFGYAGLDRLLALACLYPLGQMSLETLPCILIGLGRYGTAGVMSALMALVQACSIAAPALLGSDLSVICLSASVAAGLNFTILAGVAWACTGPGESGGPAPTLMQQLRHSVPLGVQSSISAVSQRLDRLLVGLSHPPSTLALYSVGATEVPLIPVLPYAVGRSLVPQFTRLRREGEIGALLSLWHRSILKVSLLILPCFSLCFLLAPQIMTIVFGAGFVGAAAVFRLYLLLMPLRPTAYGTMLQALDDTPAVMYGAILALALNGIIGLALLPLIGWVGPAAGAVTAQVTLILFYMSRISRATGCRWRDLWPWKRYGVRAGLCLAAACCSAPVLWLSAAPLIQVAGVSLIFSLLYLLGLWRLGEIGRSDIDQLRRWMGLRAMPPPES